MPRSSDRERQRAEQRVRDYLAPAMAEPPDLKLVLSAASIAKAMRISRATIRKYGLEALIREAQARRQSSSTPRRVSPILEKLESLRVERDLWMSRYHELLQLYTRLEFHLRNHPDVDIDALLDRPLRKPIRSVPAASGRSR